VQPFDYPWISRCVATFIPGQPFKQYCLLAMLKANADLQLGMNVQDRQQIFTRPHPDPEVPGTVCSCPANTFPDARLSAARAVLAFFLYWPGLTVLQGAVFIPLPAGHRNAVMPHVRT
jgi:hypothetical protein